MTALAKTLTPEDRRVSSLGFVNGAELFAGGGIVSAFRGGCFVGRAWGPAADRTGNWFAFRAGEDPVRVESYDAAVAHITGGES